MIERINIHRDKRVGSLIHHTKDGRSDRVGLRSEGLEHFRMRLNTYPLLTKEQEVLLFQALEKEKAEDSKGQLSGDERKIKLNQLKNDPEFKDTVTDDTRGKFKTAFAESRSISELIANCNIRLVFSVANKWKGIKLSTEDRAQEGTVGLMKAVDSFDYREGNKFSSYAIECIEREIKRGEIETGRTIRYPEPVLSALRSAKQVIEKFRIKHGKQPSRDEWISGIIESSDQIKPWAAKSAVLIVSSGEENTLSLDQPIGDEGDITVGETIQYPTHDITDPNSAHGKRTHTLISSALSKLPERQRRAIANRFTISLSDSEDEFRELENELGVSSNAIQQREKRAFAKLRNDPDLAELVSVEVFSAQDDKETLSRNAQQERLERKQQTRELTPEITPEVLEKLPDRSQQVLKMFHGWFGEEKKSLKEIGAMFGISDKMVHKVKRQALEKINLLIRS